MRVQVCKCVCVNIGSKHFGESVLFFFVGYQDSNSGPQ